MSATEKKKQTTTTVVPITKAVLPNGVTEEMVNAWRAKYGEDAMGEENVKVIVLSSKTDPNKKFSCVVRNPDSKILGMAMPFMEKNLYKLCQILITNCFLGGDEVMKEYPPFIMAAGGKISEWLDQVESDIINF